MAIDQNELGETVYYLCEIAKRQHELLTRCTLESSALAAALSQYIPDLVTRFEKEIQILKTSVATQKAAEISQALDSLIERLKRAYGPLEN
jgi:hypothetical protein